MEEPAANEELVESVESVEDGGIVVGGESVEGELVGGGEVVGGEELAEGEGLAASKELVNGETGCASEVEVVRTEKFVIATYPSVFLPFPSSSRSKKKGTPTINTVPNPRYQIRTLLINTPIQLPKSLEVDPESRLNPFAACYMVRICYQVILLASAVRTLARGTRDSSSYEGCTGSTVIRGSRR